LLTGRGSFLFIIIGESLLVAGRFTSTLELRCSCLRSSSGLGIPGVGVAPGFMAFRSSSGLGIPGVGVAPLGTLLAFAGSGIPGVEFDDGAIGLALNPGGKLLAFTATFPLPI
jgi:hypothetical protein